MSVITMLVVLMFVMVLASRECKLRKVLSGHSVKWTIRDVLHYAMLFVLTACFFASLGVPGPLRSP